MKKKGTLVREKTTREIAGDEIKYIIYMCDKGKCKFYQNNICQKNRKVKECAKQGLKNKE